MSSQIIDMFHNAMLSLPPVICLIMNSVFCKINIATSALSYSYCLEAF